MIRNVTSCYRAYYFAPRDLPFLVRGDGSKFEVSPFSSTARRRFHQLSVAVNAQQWKGKTLLSSAAPAPARHIVLRLSTFMKINSTGSTGRRYCSSKMGVFRFSDYDCIGFDLDNTLLRYNVTNMVTLEYEVLSKFLVEKRGYDRKYLYAELTQKDFDFMQKGLVLDFARGNVVRVSPAGFILRASHGTKILSDEELNVVYPDRRWTVTDTFASDLLVTWNGPLSEQMRTLLDYFDMPASLVFAKVIDTIDEKNGNQKSTECYTVWPDVLDGLIDMFSREHFASDEGIYFPALKENPDKYLHRSSPELVSWLKELKKSRLTYLITGSNIDFADFTASYAFGKDWKSLFDIIVCYARKPGFFTGSRPFLKLSHYSESDIVTADELKKDEIYSQGNWKDLKQFFTKETGKSSPVCLYVGDNLIQDIYTPKRHADCDTVAVVEEQLAEGMLDHSLSHKDADTLNSKIWGSYFQIETKEKALDSLWSHVINNYSKVCVPSVEFIVANSLDTPLKSFGVEEDKKLSGYYPGKPKSVIL